MVSLFPGDPPLAFREVASIGVDGYRLQVVCQGEHTGTHWGAPGHFNPGQPLADELDPQDLFLPAVRIDKRQECAEDPDYEVSVDDLRRWEEEYGRIPPGAAVILQTGWEDRWGTPAYSNLDHSGVPRQPGFGIETVRWLVDTCRLGHRGALGTDAFSPDRGVDRTFAVSRLLYQRHRISLEVLAHLDLLPVRGAWILAGGQINRRGTGSPALIYGLIPPSARAARG